MSKRSKFSGLIGVNGYRRIGSIQLRTVLVISMCAVLSACAGGSPEARLVNRHGLQASIRDGGDYVHTVYAQHSEAPKSARLHVYLGGDGTPWHGDVPAQNPSPRNPLALRLMLEDKNDAVFVGRPCYHLARRMPECEPQIWTSGRYSAPVVASLARAIQQITDDGDYRSIILFGYSGGGVLAVLVARHLTRTAAVITVAANLDIDAWVQHHGYDPLDTSLNPARETRLPSVVRQVHLAGGQDRTVPAATTRQYFVANPAAASWSYPSFDHICCWQSVWPDILSRVDAMVTD